MQLIHDDLAAIQVSTQSAGGVESASGPYSVVRFNALKHGVLSRYTVLSHEDAGEFQVLLDALVNEHRPKGPTETHLVEELAAVVWRKRRVLQAEGAGINRGLLAVARARHDRPLDPAGPARSAVPFQPAMVNSQLNHPVELAQAMREAPAETKSRLAEAEEDMAATDRAAGILRRGGNRAYAHALRALTPSSAETFRESVDDGEHTATAESLLAFINDFLLPFCRQTLIDVQNHDAVKAQTLGEGLQAHRLEKLSRYETHLDRKFERTLAMLLKLKELRREV